QTCALPISPAGAAGAPGPGAPGSDRRARARGSRADRPPRAGSGRRGALRRSGGGWRAPAGSSGYCPRRRAAGDTRGRWLAVRRARAWVPHRYAWLSRCWSRLLSVRAARPVAGRRLAGAIPSGPLLAIPDLLGERLRLFLVGRELHAHRIDLRLHRAALALELTLLALRLAEASCLLGALLGLLVHTRRPGEHAAAAEGDRQHVDPARADHELANLVRMSHAARLHQEQPAGALRRDLDVPDLEPRIDERRDADLGLLEAGSR